MLGHDSGPWTSTSPAVGYTLRRKSQRQLGQPPKNWDHRATATTRRFSSTMGTAPWPDGDGDGCDLGYYPLVVGAVVLALLALAAASASHDAATSSRLRLAYSFTVAAASLPSLHRLPLPAGFVTAHTCVADGLLLRPPAGSVSARLLLGVWAFGPLLLAAASVLLYNMAASALSCCTCSRRSNSTPWSTFEASTHSAIQQRAQLQSGVATSFLWLSYLCFSPLCDALARALEETADDGCVDRRCVHTPRACAALSPPRRHPAATSALTPPHRPPLLATGRSGTQWRSRRSSRTRCWCRSHTSPEAPRGSQRPRRRPSTTWPCWRRAPRLEVLLPLPPRQRRPPAAAAARRATAHTSGECAHVLRATCCAALSLLPGAPTLPTPTDAPTHSDLRPLPGPQRPWSAGSAWC